VISTKPVLWHIAPSHYSEKVRWALDWKGIDYTARAPIPGPHMGVALVLTRGAHKTFPILQLDGTSIGDSSAIIAAIEEAYPERPLYPEDPAERRRALVLEEYFDEELGPHGRLLAFHELRRDPESLKDFTATLLPGPLAGSDAVRSGVAKVAGAFAGVRYGVGSDEAADLARTKTIAALDRLEAELAEGDGEHLVGDRFTVADLTAACMFIPLVTPPEGPPGADAPAAIQRFREPLRERPGYRWVEETFRRYRRPVRV